MGSAWLRTVVLTDAERLELTALAGRRRTAQGLAERARIVLAASEGGSCPAVAARLGLHADTVRKWWHRFAADRLEGLRDDPRPGAPRTVEDVRIEAVVARTLESLPPEGTHWSSRGMARASGLSVSTVQRIWRAFGLQPHRSETFKLSTDPDFVAKVGDVVGLYMAPRRRYRPGHWQMLCPAPGGRTQAFPGRGGGERAGRPRRALGDGQLRHAHSTRG